MILHKPKRLLSLPVAGLFCAGMLVVAAHADHFDGGAGAGNPSWNASLNWALDAVPSAGNGTVQAINVPGYGVVVDNAGVQADAVDVATWGWNGDLTIAAAGTLSTAGNVLIANGATVTGSVVNAGALDVGAAIYMQEGLGSLYNSGTLTANGIVLGNTADSASTLVNSGDITVNGWIYLSYLASNTASRLVMEGGAIAAQKIEMAGSGRGHMDLHGGTINLQSFGLNGNGGYTIDITAGVLIADGDHTAGMNWMASLGLITAYGGEGFVVAEYDPLLDRTKLYAKPITHGPIAVEKGGFTVKKTGSQFFPVGFNYIDLRTNDVGILFHDTFNPNRYDDAIVSSNLAEIAAAGFNTVRVFIDSAVGPESVVLASTDTELSSGYMQCVAGFLEQAHVHDIYVLITFSHFPGTYKYYSLVNTVPNVDGMNFLYLNSGAIDAHRLFMRDFIQALGLLAPERLEDTVFAFDPQNEVTHYVNAKPFVLSSGTVTPANGITYDIAAQKVQLADEMGVYWIDQMAEEIHMQAPGVLVDANVFTYHAVGRSIGDFSLYGSPYTNLPGYMADWRDRYPFRPEALAASGADFMDIHFYTEDAAHLQADLDSIEFPDASNAWSQVERPMIVGEFGAFKHMLTFPGAVNWKRDETDAFAANGFQGWLYWTYYNEFQPELWHAIEGYAEIFNALEEGAKVNYFGYPLPTDDTDGDNLPDSWEILKFWTTSYDGDDDPDGDGVFNRQEYLAGTHPNLSTSKFFIIGGQATGAEVQVQWSTVSGKTYQLMRTESLSDPCWSAAGDPVPGTGSPASLAVPDAVGQGFYKVRVNR